MIKNIQEVVRQKVDKGLNTYKNFFNLSESQSPSCLNVEFNNDGSFSKRLGSSTMNTTVLEGTAGYGMYDFGVLGAGGNDNQTVLLLHGNGEDGSGAVTDSSANNFAVSHSGGVSIDTAQSQLGGASILFPAAEDSNTQLLLHMDGLDASTTFIDDGVNNFAVTANGNAQIDTAQSKFGGASGQFDGNGDYLSLPDSNAWDFGSGDFTLDFWVRWSSYTAYTMFYEQWQNADNFVEFYNDTPPSTQWSFVVRSGASNLGIIRFSPPAISTNTWYHVALVRKGNSSSDWLLFVNGVSYAATFESGSPSFTIPNIAGSVYRSE